MTVIVINKYITRTTEEYLRNTNINLTGIQCGVIRHV